LSNRVFYLVLLFNCGPAVRGKVHSSEGVLEMESSFRKFGLPVKDNVPKQIYLSCVKNVAWTNKNGETVIIESIGRDCFISEDATFGNDVTLGDEITIHMDCVIGKSKCRTIIGDATAIFAHSIISGEVYGMSRVEAYTIIENGVVVSEKKSTSKNGSAGYHGKHHVASDSYDHYAYNHI